MCLARIKSCQKCDIGFYFPPVIEVPCDYVFLAVLCKSQTQAVCFMLPLHSLCAMTEGPPLILRFLHVLSSQRCMLCDTESQCNKEVTTPPTSCIYVYIAVRFYFISLASPPTFSSLACFFMHPSLLYYCHCSRLWAATLLPISSSKQPVRGQKIKTYSSQLSDWGL